MISLPASLESSLQWSEAHLLAQQKQERGEKILWKLDFGWDSAQISLDDPTAFFSFGIAIEHFVKTLWPHFQESTWGVCLYEGELNFSEKFLWGASLQERYRESGETYALFTAKVFAEYLHRLGAQLPDAVDIYCLFDTSDLSLSAQLMSKEHFEHVRIISKEPFGEYLFEEGRVRQREEYPLAVCLPLHERCDEKALADLNRIFAKLRQVGTPFRIVHEALLTEEWRGVEQLIVVPSAVSAQGKRKLQGFCAAGGEIITDL